MSDYTDKYDKKIIVAMSLVITLCVGAVVAMTVATLPDCYHSYMTYCEPQHHDDHH